MIVLNWILDSLFLSFFSCQTHHDGIIAPFEPKAPAIYYSIFLKINQNQKGGNSKSEGEIQISEI